MITANPQVAPNGTGQDPGETRPEPWVRSLRGLGALASATFIYVVFALVWSAAGRRDADYARAAAFAASCGSSAALVISILAAHAEREIKSTRWGWSAVVVAAAAASASAIAGLYAVWSDGAVLWRPVELRWIESGGAFALLAGCLLLVEGTELPDDDIASLFGLLTLVLGFVAPILVAGSVAIGGWPADWSVTGSVLGTTAATAAALFIGAFLLSAGPAAGARPIGLFVSAVIFAVSPLLQDVGQWSSSLGWMALGRWLMPVATLGLTASILNPWSLPSATLTRAESAGVRRAVDGMLPVAVWCGLAVAAAVALMAGRAIATELSALALAAAVFLLARFVWSLRGERRRVQRLMRTTIELERIANVDLVTGLPNRTALDARLEEEMERAIRYAQPLSILFVDIDYFKRVNDLHGHAAGDRVLREVALRLQATARSIDFVGRYGGEEFVVIAPGTWTADALVLGERLRSHIEQTRVEVSPNESLAVTISVGIAGFPEHAESLKGLVERADQALYRSKSAGRNRVTLFANSVDG